LVNIYPCSGFQQLSGMRYGLEMRRLQRGGSAEVQQIVLSSPTIISNPTGAYWKLVSETTVVTPIGSSFIWNTDPISIHNEILNTLGMSVAVTREGFGSKEEYFGYEYTLSFDESDDDVALFQALTDGGISMPVLQSSSYSQTNDDLSAFGSFNGTVDTEFTITINSTVNATTLPNKFVWNAAGGSNSAPINIVAGRSVYLSDGVYIKFASSTGHGLGDTWSFVGVRTADILPTGYCRVYPVKGWNSND
jgi:hypothetical protein